MHWYYAAVTLIVVSWNSPRIMVCGQTESLICDSVTATARALTVADHGCGFCPYPPVCVGCVPGQTLDDSNTCTSGCAYCDKITEKICGGYSYTVVSNNGNNSTEFAWFYTEGRTGNTALVTFPANQTCSVSVNHTRCTACQPVICTDGTVDYTIDCTNLVAGASTTACTNPVSSMASALASTTTTTNTNTSTGGQPQRASLQNAILDGALAGLYIPFEGCKDGFVMRWAPPKASSSMSTMNDLLALIGLVSGATAVLLV